MPRPKGSKNKSPRKTAKPTSISTTDFTSPIAEKSSSKEALVADIATLEENLTSEPFPKKWTRKMRKKQNEANRSE